MSWVLLQMNYYKLIPPHFEPKLIYLVICADYILYFGFSLKMPLILKYNFGYIHINYFYIGESVKNYFAIVRYSNASISGLNKDILYYTPNYEYTTNEILRNHSGGVSFYDLEYFSDWQCYITIVLERKDRSNILIYIQCAYNSNHDYYICVLLRKHTGVVHICNICDSTSDWEYSTTILIERKHTATSLFVINLIILQIMCILQIYFCEIILVLSFVNNVIILQIGSIILKIYFNGNIQSTLINVIILIITQLISSIRMNYSENILVLCTTVIIVIILRIGSVIPRLYLNGDILVTFVFVTNVIILLILCILYKVWKTYRLVQLCDHCDYTLNWSYFTVTIFERKHTGNIFPWDKCDYTSNYKCFTYILLRKHICAMYFYYNCNSASDWECDVEFIFKRKHKGNMQLCDGYEYNWYYDCIDNSIFQKHAVAVHVWDDTSHFEFNSINICTHDLIRICYTWDESVYIHNHIHILNLLDIILVALINTILLNFIINYTVIVLIWIIIINHHLYQMIHVIFSVYISYSNFLLHIND